MCGFPTSDRRLCICRWEILPTPYIMSGQQTYIPMVEEISSKNTSDDHSAWPFKKFNVISLEVKDEFLSECAKLLADLELRKIPVSARALQIAVDLFEIDLFDWAYDILIHSSLGENPLDFLAFVINHWLGESISPQHLNKILSAISFKATTLAAVVSESASLLAAPTSICINQYASSSTDRQSFKSTKKVSSAKHRKSRKKSQSNASLPIAIACEMFNFSESDDPLPRATGSLFSNIKLRRSIYDPMIVKVPRQYNLIKKSVNRLLDECSAVEKNAHKPPFQRHEIELLVNEFENDAKSFCDFYLAESESVLNACIESAYVLINTDECVYDFVIPLILMWKMILNEKSLTVAEVSRLSVPEGQQSSPLTSEPMGLRLPLSQSKAIADSQTLCSDSPTSARLADLAEDLEFLQDMAPVPESLQADISVIPPCTMDEFGWCFSLFCNHEFLPSKSEIKQSDLIERVEPLSVEGTAMQLQPCPLNISDIQPCNMYDSDSLVHSQPCPLGGSDTPFCSMHSSESVGKLQPCPLNISDIQPCNMYNSESLVPSQTCSLGGSDTQSCNMYSSESVEKFQSCSLNVSTVLPCNKHGLDPLLKSMEIAEIQSCLSCSPEALPFVRRNSASLSSVAGIPEYPYYPSCSTEELPTSVGIAVVLTCLAALLKLHSNLINDEPLVTSEEVAETLVIPEKYEVLSVNTVVETVTHDGFLPGSGGDFAATVAEVHSFPACPEAALVPVCPNVFRDTDCPEVPCVLACPEALLVVSCPDGVVNHTCPDSVLIFVNSDFNSLPCESGLEISLRSTGGLDRSPCDLQRGSSRPESRWNFKVFWEISEEFCHDYLDWFDIECFITDSFLGHCLGGNGYCSGSCDGHCSKSHGSDGCHPETCGADGHGFWDSGSDGFCPGWINSGILLVNLQSKHFTKYVCLERRLESAFKGGGNVRIASVAFAFGCDCIAAKALLHILMQFHAACLGPVFRELLCGIFSEQSPLSSKQFPGSSESLSGSSLPNGRLWKRGLMFVSLQSSFRRLDLLITCHLCGDWRVQSQRLITL